MTPKLKIMYLIPNTLNGRDAQGKVWLDCTLPYHLVYKRHGEQVPCCRCGEVFSDGMVSSDNLRLAYCEDCLEFDFRHQVA